MKRSFFELEVTRMLTHRLRFLAKIERRFAPRLRPGARASLTASLLLLPGIAGAQVAIHLLPQPREVRLAGEIAIPSGIRVVVPGHDPEDEFAARDLTEAASGIGTKAESAYPVNLLRADSHEAKELLVAKQISFSPELAAEGYVLVIEPKRATVIAESASGVFYGVQTFKQLLPLPGNSSATAIPEGTIRDWPAMKYRAIDDDLSRGPFPTLEFQKHQIREIAAFKANIYSPYIEHTLLYPNQPLAAPPGSALSPADVADLVRYGAQYHVMILPEQEAFGHLHHVLKYDLYSDVAETPHGHVLAPGQPGTLPLIQDWFGEIAKEFPSPFMHIGADETVDLGHGRTKDAVTKQGYGPVYVEFLKQIHDGLAPLHKRLLFWGDIGGDAPAAVPGLPKDMIAVPWNYGDTKGFDKMIEPFAKAGIETWVAPGDANWNLVYPDANVAFGNIQGFIRDGQRLGSTGALVTVWNDDGEGLFNQDWYGVLFGAVAAWQPGESNIPAYQAAYGAAFHGDPTGKIDQAQQQLMLANQDLATAHTDFNSDQLFWLDPWSAEGRVAGAKLLPVAQQLRLHAEHAIVLIAQAGTANPQLRETDALEAMDLGARRLDLIGLKWELSHEIVENYGIALVQQHDKKLADQTHNMLDEISSNNGRLQDLRDAYSATRDEYARVWMSENRPYWLANVLVRYDLQVQKWQERGWRFEELVRIFESGKELPTADALGLPPAS
jgi:hexosaminidase